ncbi:MAG: molybdopterin-synthase adenylyltransferase MoeB [Opitutales bacterium]|nr:molybdopterin-synthase adenylyltransferase MoeB [Opitutales bacterium]
MTPEELQRYSRQIILPGFGTAGQQRLRGARALVVGAGGLGSPASIYLAAAGVGTLGMVEFDTVERHNLHRQILHSDAAVGRSKLESAEARLREINPHVRFTGHADRLTAENARRIFKEYDIVVDGSDNFATRYLVNDAAALCRKPLVYGAIFQFEGQIALFAPHLGGPCYRCLFPEPPPPGAVPNCAEAGVFGALAGTVGSLQALLAMRQLAGIGEPPLGQLMRFDALRWRTTRFTVPKNENCALCGAAPSITDLDPARYAPAACAAPTPTNADTMNSTAGSETPMEITAEAAHDRLADDDPPVLLDVREPFEVEIGAIDGHRHIPLRQLPEAYETLPRDRPVVVYCHHGMRSLRAAEFLRAKGFARAQSLAGGIDRWSTAIDPAVPRY